MIPALVLRSVKVAIVNLVGGVAYIWAQIEFPDLDTVGSVGLVAVLATLVGRYTFNQLEGYRADLRLARERIDSLEQDLHEQGKAKSAADARVRELENYAHRLRLYIMAQGLAGNDLPEPPASRP